MLSYLQKAAPRERGPESGGCKQALDHTMLLICTAGHPDQSDLELLQPGKASGWVVQ